MKMLLVFNHFDDFLLLFTTGVNFVPFVSYHLVSYHLVWLISAPAGVPLDGQLLWLGCPEIFFYRFPYAGTTDLQRVWQAQHGRRPRPEHFVTAFSPAADWRAAEPAC